ncbi:hypothetical protein ES705_17700 [subsurface metagenome]
MLNVKLPNHPKIHKMEYFMEKLLTKYNIDVLILFGSVVKGLDNYRSDIDVLIVSDDMGRDWFERHQNAYSLSIGLIQPFVLTKKQFENAIENRQTIVWEALTDGKLLKDTGIGKLMIQRFNKLIENGEIKRMKKGWKINSKAF